MARLFADEDFPFPAAKRLRELGHDVITALDAGLAGIGASDSEILVRAVQLGRTVVTMNRCDFIALHAADPNHAGIIVCTRDADTEALANRIDASLAAGEERLGRLIRVNRPNPQSVQPP